MAGIAEDICGVWGGGRLVWALHVPKVILRLGYKVKYRYSTPAVPRKVEGIGYRTLLSEKRCGDDV